MDRFDYSSMVEDRILMIPLEIRDDCIIGEVVKLFYQNSQICITDKISKSILSFSDQQLLIWDSSVTFSELIVTAVLFFLYTCLVFVIGMQLLSSEIILKVFPLFLFHLCVSENDGCLLILKSGINEMYTILFHYNILNV